MSGTISLRFAMVQGDFQGLSSDRLSVASLSRRIPDDEFGRTYLHLAARWGTLNRIPDLDLVDPAMDLLDTQGLSVKETWDRYGKKQTASSKSSIHIESPHSAKRFGNEEAQPLEGEENIVPPSFSPDSTHLTPLQQQWLDLVAPSFTPDSTPLTPVQENILAAINGNGSVPPYLNKEDLLKALPNDQCGTTLIHVAAAKGKIQEFPCEFLDAEMMLCRDSNGRTPLHRAASRKTFHLIPSKLLNKATLSAEDNSGVSVMDLLIRKDLVSIVPQSVVSTLPSFIEAQFLEAIRNDEALPLEAQDIKFLSGKPRSFHFDGSWYHWLAAEGILGILSEKLIPEDINRLRDSRGRTPVHVSVEGYGLGDLPAACLSSTCMFAVDETGQNAFHKLALLQELGGAPPNYFTREALLTTENNGLSVADLIEEYGNTDLLPINLRCLTRDRALREFHRLLKDNFVKVENVWQEQLSPVIDQEEFNQWRNQFVRDWYRTHFKHALDEQQAEAVIASGRDLLVSARAGSGKTGTLVARALFEIEKRGVDPRKIVILAFNKKAAREVRNRLVKLTGEERCPHVMTFHSLAYRLVHPKKDSILLDEKDSEEGEALSQGLNNLIDDEIRHGKLVEEIRQIMAIRWKGEWNQIVSSGGLLPQEEALPFREAHEFQSIDGRRFQTTMEKVVADELVRRGKRYYHRPVTHRSSGKRYIPAFSVSEGGRRVIIDIAGTVDRECLQAAERYWSGDKSSGAVRIELPDLEACGGIAEFRRELIAAIEGDDLGWMPLNEDLIWERIKKRTIGEFTRAVVTFVGRCQKEIWTPEILAERFASSEIEIERIKPREDPELEACVLFWKVCHRLFLAYLEHLKKIEKMDFDHLMMNAATLICQGRTRFSSKWSQGDLAEIEHVFVDEYQDFSHLFNALRESIQNRNPSARFFCVGDDWQAINGFAGSNLRYFHGFSDIFPNYRKLEILMNYRSAPEIVELGNRVMKDLGSPSLPTREQKGRVCQIFADSESAANDEWEECVEEQLGPKAVPLLKLISRSMDEGKQLLVLFRNGTVWTSSRSLVLKDFRKELISWLEVDPKDWVVFSTTHGYKGGESDHVVLVDPEDYPVLHADRMFSQIFGDTDHSISADERRLFYVGVTRAKEQLVFLRDHKSRVQQGIQVPASIPFLKHESLQTASLAAVASKVDPGKRCLVRISCGFNKLGKRFNEAKFFYREERKTWRRLIGKGAPKNRFECADFLRALPWLKELENYSVEFLWKNRTEVFKFGGNEAANQMDQVVRPSDRADTSPSSQQIFNEKRRASPEGDQNVISKSIRTPETGAADRAARDSEISGVTARSGVFNTGVVGMRHDGRLRRAMALSVGEFVRLEREPSNPHDRNAIKVVASGNSHIGYLSRHIAVHLAAGLDAWGGVTQAKITSIWKQPPPNIHVSVDICFPLPPGVVIPVELDSVAQMEDNPFASTPKSKQLSGSPSQQAVTTADRMPTAQDGELNTTDQNESVLSAAELEELELILDARLQNLIKSLAIEQSIPFPTVGFDGGIGDIADGSILEVAWPDHKIGVATPENEIGPFEKRKWTIFRSVTVNANDLRQVFHSSLSSEDNIPF